MGPVALQRFTPLAPEQAFWHVSPPGQRFTPLAPEQAFWRVSPPGQRFTPLAPGQAFWHVSPPGQRFTPLAPEQAFWRVSPPGQRFTPLAPEQAFWHVSPPGEFVVSASLTHFSVAFFSFSTRVGVAQVVFRPFSEEIVPRVAVDPVWPWEEVSSGSC